jgi:hypothetical protein
MKYYIVTVNTMTEQENDATQICIRSSEETFAKCSAIFHVSSQSDELKWDSFSCTATHKRNHKTYLVALISEIDQIAFKALSQHIPAVLYTVEELCRSGNFAVEFNEILNQAQMLTFRDLSIAWATSFDNEGFINEPDFSGFLKLFENSDINGNLARRSGILSTAKGMRNAITEVMYQCDSILVSKGVNLEKPLMHLLLESYNLKRTKKDLREEFGLIQNS